jgi:hypothetical protein
MLGERLGSLTLDPFNLGFDVTTFMAIHKAHARARLIEEGFEFVWDYNDI